MSTARIIAIPGGPGLGGEAYFSPYLDSLKPDNRFEIFETNDFDATKSEDLCAPLGTAISKNQIEGVPNIILGHSYGGYLALKFLEWSQDKATDARVDGMILVSWVYSSDFVKYRSDDLDEVGEFAPTDDKQAGDDWYKAFNLHWRRAFFGEKQDRLATQYLDSLEYRDELWKSLENEVFTDLSLREPLADQRIPVLSITGTKDWSVPRTYVRKGFDLLGSDHKVWAELEGVGHFPFVERRAEFCDIVNNFIIKEVRNV